MSDYFTQEGLFSSALANAKFVTDTIHKFIPVEFSNLFHNSCWRSDLSLTVINSTVCGHFGQFAFETKIDLSKLKALQKTVNFSSNFSCLPDVNRELDDLVIARGDGMPTYNFGAVVDDLDMGITHVIRGDDHVMNTPRQLNVIAALGASPPRYAHVPMILGPDGQRLSKRHGAVGVTRFRDDGYLPEALLNHLVRLGWSHGDREIFLREEMVELFDVAHVNRAPASFDYDKLDWLNQHHIRQADPERLGALLAGQFERMGIDVSGGAAPSLLATIQRERARTLAEMAEKSRFAFEEYGEFDERAAKKHLRPVALEPLEAMRARLHALPGWEPAALHAAVAECAEALSLNLGKVAQPLRVALTGTAASPAIELTLQMVGRDVALSRLDRAIAYVRGAGASGFRPRSGA